MKTLLLHPIIWWVTRRCCDERSRRDCTERALCPQAGTSGHEACGWHPSSPVTLGYEKEEA